MKAADKNALIQNLRRIPASRLDLTVLDISTSPMVTKILFKRIEREIKSGGKTINIISSTE